MFKKLLQIAFKCTLYGSCTFDITISSIYGNNSEFEVILLMREKFPAALSIAGECELSLPEQLN